MHWVPLIVHLVSFPDMKPSENFLEPTYTQDSRIQERIH